MKKIATHVTASSFHSGGIHYGACVNQQQSRLFLQIIFIAKKNFPNTRIMRQTSFQLFFV